MKYMDNLESLALLRKAELEKDFTSLVATKDETAGASFSRLKNL